MMVASVTTPTSFRPIDLATELAAAPSVLATEPKKALEALGFSLDDNYHGALKRLGSWFDTCFGSIDKLTPLQAAKLSGELEAMNLSFVTSTLSGALASYANAYINLVRLLAVRDFVPDRQQESLVYWAAGAFGESAPDRYGSYSPSMTEEKADQLIAVLRGVQADPRWLLDETTLATMAKLEKQAIAVREAHLLVGKGDGGKDGPLADALAYFDIAFGGVDKLRGADAQAALRYVSKTGHESAERASQRTARAIAYVGYSLLIPDLNRRPASVDGWRKFLTEDSAGRDLSEEVGIDRAAEVVIAMMSTHDPSQVPLIQEAQRTAAQRQSS